MKILWVNPSFLDYRVPVYKCLNELTGNGLFLVYSKQRIPQQCINKAETALKENALGLPKEKIIKIGSKGDFANTGITIPYPQGLYKLICSVKPDIIIGEGYFQWTPWAVFRAKKLKIPFIMAYERTAHTERNCPWWRRYYRKMMDKMIDGYIVNGSLTKSYIESSGVRNKPIVTGVMSADSQNLAKAVKNFSAYEKENLIKELHLSSGITYLFVGRLIELKGVKYLLEAWKKHITQYPADNLLIVGDGPLYKQFQTTYSSISNITLTGGIDYDNIYKYYAIANIFIMPTLEDNWSLVIPESMACGLPVACSIYNGCYPELIQDNGILFDTYKQNTILEALHFFHNTDIEKAGNKSIEIEQQFNPQKAAERIYNLCLDMTK